MTYIRNIKTTSIWMVGLGVGGAILSSRAAYRIGKKVADGAKPKTIWNTDKKKFLKEFVVPFIPAIACAVGAVVIGVWHEKTWKSLLTSSQAVATTALAAVKDYREAVEENLKEDDQVAVEQAVARRRASRAVSEPMDLQLDAGDQLILDAFSGQYFASSIDRVRLAFEKARQFMMTTGENLSVSELNDYVNAQATKPIHETVAGEMMGFMNHEAKDLNPVFAADILPTGKPYLIMETTLVPERIAF